LVWLFDGLDRIADPLEFDKIVEPLLLGLKDAGIGVAIVGPRRVVSGVDRLGAASRFDELHLMGPVNPASNDGFRFLAGVLIARKVDEVVPNEHLKTLIDFSGGAIRLLLQLVREAIKETWVSNAQALGANQVAVAVDKIGRSLLLGLTDRELMLLKSLLETGSFAARTDDDAALVLTNRVLEYRDVSGLSRHVVHPCLISFIRALPAPSAD
jgi:hypothetical protein